MRAASIVGIILSIVYIVTIMINYLSFNLFADTVAGGGIGTIFSRIVPVYALYILPWILCGILFKAYKNVNSPVFGRASFRYGTVLFFGFIAVTVDIVFAFGLVVTGTTAYASPESMSAVFLSAAANYHSGSIPAILFSGFALVNAVNSLAKSVFVHKKPTQTELGKEERLQGLQTLLYIATIVLAIVLPLIPVIKSFFTIISQLS